jgi:hypothetical protein
MFVSVDLPLIFFLTKLTISQPNHPGTMVQVGWNMGPRHAREYGLAKSYTKILDWDTTVDHDKDVTAAMTLTWAICMSFFPIDLTRSIEKNLQASGLPRIATRSIGEGVFPKTTAMYCS